MDIVVVAFSISGLVAIGIYIFIRCAYKMKNTEQAPPSSKQLAEQAMDKPKVVLTNFAIGVLVFFLGGFVLLNLFVLLLKIFGE